MRGTVGDGMLVRASTVRYEDTPAWPYLARFLSELMQNVPGRACGPACKRDPVSGVIGVQ